MNFDTTRCASTLDEALLPSISLGVPRAMLTPSLDGLHAYLKSSSSRK
jgi:hypothetical protein